MISRNLLKLRTNGIRWKSIPEIYPATIRSASSQSRSSRPSRSNGRPESRFDPKKRSTPHNGSHANLASPKEAFKFLANESAYALQRKVPKYQQLSAEDRALRYLSRHKLIKEVMDNSLRLTDKLYNDHISSKSIDISATPVEDLFKLRLECAELAMKDCYERKRVKLFRRLKNHLFPQWRCTNDTRVSPAVDMFWQDLRRGQMETSNEPVEPWKDWIQYVNFSRDPPVLPNLNLLQKAMEQFGIAIVDEKQNNIRIFNVATAEILTRSFAKYIMKQVFHNRSYDPSKELELRNKVSDRSTYTPSTTSSNTTTTPPVPSATPVPSLSPALGILDLENPAWLFPAARAIHRKVYLHIGPTNSGKTYNALQAFQSSKSGFYAGPLRLLAREVYNRMKASKKPCSLVTGEEVIEEFDENGNPAQLSSGTVEMMDINTPMDIAVLDEIQMIDDSERGWAWTQAFLAVQAKEVHLCGDPNTEELVKKLAVQAGDELEIIKYERLSPLEVEAEELKDDLSQLEPGDCLVFFSKRHILAAKNIIEAETGNKCAVIYGSLPAETRSKQAELFNDPDSDVKFLVASDAIGMGLNLAIRRVIFSRVTKFNGKKLIKLPIAQVKQIAGRAGRYQIAPSKDNVTSSTSNIGYVTSLKKSDREYITECLALPSPLVKRAVFFPLDTIIHEFAHSIGPNVSYHHILSRMEGSIRLPKLYKFADLSSMISTSKLFQRIKGLMLEEMMVLAKAPVNSNDDLVKEAFYSFCLVIANGQSKTITEIPHTGVGHLGVNVIPTLRPTDTLESVHRVLTLYLWLSYRFPTHFLDRTGATQLKELCEMKINDLLRKSPHIRQLVGRKVHSHDTGKSSSISGLMKPQTFESRRAVAAA